MFSCNKSIVLGVGQSNAFDIITYVNYKEAILMLITTFLTLKKVF